MIETEPRAGRAVRFLAVIVVGHVLGIGDVARPALPRHQRSVPAVGTAGSGEHGFQGLVPVAADSGPAVPLVLPTSPDQWLDPRGQNGGTEGLARFLAAVALHDNKPLYLSDTWGRTTGSDRSDHHMRRTDSWACDVAVLGVQVPTPATELAARRIATALGEPDWKGGDLTKTVNGYRFQILWKVPGHFNHVHIGVRKVA